MTTISEIQEALRKPFARDDIEFRVCRTSGKSPKVNVLAYITARGIMQRLDEVFGIGGWKDEYEVLQSGVKCRLSVKIGDEVITKEDAASSTNVEPLKGAFSDSLKRAGVKFGIGRYLYDLPDTWVDLLQDKPMNPRNPIHYHSSDNYSGWWMEPDLPGWALPGTSVKQEKTHDADTANSDPLTEKINLLKEKGLLTESKYQSLQKTIVEKASSPALMRHISTQMDYILRWDDLTRRRVIDTETGKDLYNRIISADGKSLKLIASELDAYDQRRAA